MTFYQEVFMALTPSTMLELGTIAPDFTLTGPEGKSYRLQEKRLDKGLLVIFMCNHCPYVIHIRPKLVERIKEFQAKGIEVVAINSNDAVNYPDDSPMRMLEDAKKFGYTFPYLVDAEQLVAKAYRAACTPDLYLFNAEKKLVYRGQFDNARPGNSTQVTGLDLADAVNKMLAGQAIDLEQRPSMGCNIKWKSGNAPEYFGI
jgi:peroxiredoxin